MSEPLTKPENRSTDTVVVRGICSAILSMGMPTFDNLRILLSSFGYNLTKK